ncbi:MAG TPA: protein kinase [Oligoflexia bacterium]|nr:protein kinase [Oligoflexia bacterium]HMP49808.1 protein kinase [Oligoflexia bacterium]
MHSGQGISGVMFADRYEIISMLGRGGMGDVCLAKDLYLEGSLVALKLLHIPSDKNAVFIDRFAREIQVTRMVSHPNVIRTYELGHFGNRMYYTMEYIDGVTLEDELENFIIPFKESLNIFYQLCLGLKAIHNVGIVHRDIKPSNIIIGKDGVPKYSDFGTAHLKGSDLTMTHDVIGTYEYIAPELFVSPNVTPAIDIYSLGVVAYRLFAGVQPLECENQYQLIYAKSQGNIQPIKSKAQDIPEFINQITQEMLALNPEERVSIDELVTRVENYIENDLGVLKSDFIHPYKVKSEFENRNDDLPPTIILNTAKIRKDNESYFDKSAREAILSIINSVKHFEVSPARKKQISFFRQALMSIILLFLMWYVFLSQSFQDKLHSPGGVRGLIAWYSASSLNLQDGDKVESLTNNGLKKNIIGAQLIEDNKPVFRKRRAYGHPVIEFDGINDFIEVNEIAKYLRNTDSATIIYVARAFNKPEQNYLFSGHLEDKDTNLFHIGFVGNEKVRIRTIKNSFTAGFHDSAPTVINGFSVYSVTFKPKSVLVHQDGRKLFEDIITDPIDFSNATYFSIGQEYDDLEPSDFFKGELAEVMFYDNALNDEDRKTVERLLAEKYLLSLRSEN